MYYVISADPDYQLDSVIRGCAYEELSTNCTNTTVGGSSLIKVNCTESCLEDGCNTGWRKSAVIYQKKSVSGK